MPSQSLPDGVERYRAGDHCFVGDPDGMAVLVKDLPKIEEQVRQQVREELTDALNGLLRRAELHLEAAGDKTEEDRAWLYRMSGAKVAFEEALATLDRELPGVRPALLPPGETC